jgi:hypothetical protein
MLAGGNVLIANSFAGRAFEIDRSGRIVWRFLVQDYSQVKLERDVGGGRASIRIERYDTDFVDALLNR